MVRDGAARSTAQRRGRSQSASGQGDSRPADREEAGPAAASATSALLSRPLTDRKPDRAGEGQQAGDVEVQSLAEDVVGGVDPEALLEDAEGRVAGDVEGEEAGGSDLAVVAEPDEEAGEAEVPDQLVEEGRLEGGVGP